MGKNKKDFDFSTKAKNYDENEGKLSERFYKLVTKNVSLEENYNVLDVGCGTGTILRRLGEKANINGYGIDVEENMINIAKNKCADMDIQICSCDKTAFNDEYFDVVIACMAYHHFPDKNGFAKEMNRIIKSGGRLYISDPKFPFVFRKIFNAALSLHKIAGKFFSIKEMEKDFNVYGFRKVNSDKDLYAQIIVLEKIGSPE